MNNKEKCVAQLESMDIQAHIENATVYVTINDTHLELAEYEIDWRAKKHDEEKAEV